MQALFLCLILLAPRFAAACGEQFFEIHNSAQTKVSYFPSTATAEPLNWHLDAFDDSAWAPAVPWTYFAPFDSPGWPYSSHDVSGTSVNDDGFLARQVFDLPANAIQIRGELMLGVDDSISTWINGAAVQAQPDGMLSVPDPSYFSVQGLKAGRNVLALRIYSASATGVGMYFQLKVSYSLPCPDLGSSAETQTYAFPSPAAGPVVHVAFSLASDGEAELKAYSLSGRLLSQAKGSFAAGQRILDLDVSGYAPGTYVYRLTLRAGGRSETLPWRSFIVARP